jgi:hypothetical protein
MARVKPARPFAESIKTGQRVPSDEAVFKILYPALKNIGKRCTIPIQNRSGMMNQFAVLFGNKPLTGNYKDISFRKIF